ncbi:alpha/beta fold hydrolase [Conexibacter woesei]|uniref:Alpha/beta hydrolase fold protein n=1 Tax=Conexibacter woesei (strain DSM 14684 / CCUG 47730 / CIP 108061 / JCM 11494 / NBRC 100937 / ID131577) TaxID=469383 RepID=D3F461_CONWI|nr:alpha/beta hydrolase [Conexibacter woesei]ADB50433.1 alpha/beta hydrolase fold protein [Conexibacter woesei DSM 14684]
MSERLYDVGRGVTLCAEGFGDPADPPLLLVMGLGMQMIRWHASFVRELTDRGLYVIRFDNRDSGRSTFMKDVPLPTLRQLATRRFDPRQYLLADMARDTVALLDALNLDRVHIAGASMGGMIAQTIAAEQPRRVRSLTSIMSNTGSRFSGQPALKTYPLLLRRAAPGRDGYIAHQVALHDAIGSPGSPADDPLFREIAECSYDRNPDPTGTPRQLAAVLASGDRTRALHRVSAPTLVIHGDADRMISISGGRATARAIPDSELVVVPGMGHDLPRGVWPEVIGALAHHVRAAERAGRAGRANDAPTRSDPARSV